MEIDSEELLIEITIRDSPQEKQNSERAFCDFICIHNDFIRRLIYWYAQKNQIETEDLYQIFIIDIWEKAHQYDDKRSESTDSIARVKLWLSSRFKAIIRNYKGELLQDSENSIFISYDDATWEPEENEEDMFENIEINDSKLLIALTENKILNEKELDILKISYAFDGEIPKEFREILCKQYKIQETTIRTIRFKALKKIKSFIWQRTVYEKNS
jgi:DNA-directed RNA polymerase specialized sigma24 family protein